jgi:peptide/nickel transport system ATP-binding protein
VLSVQDLCVAINGTELLHGVSFDAGAGEVVGLVGESGSGKTLTGLTLLGLQPRDAVAAGRVRFCGRDLLGAPEAELRRLRGAEMSMIFQEPRASLNPVLPIGRQIADVIRAHGDANRDEATAMAVGLLAEVGIPDPAAVVGAFPYELSGGMCQRVMIAMALSCGPRLLIADEPTTALDVTIQAQIVALLRRIARDRNLTVVLISHDLAMVTEVCDRVVTMYCGEVVSVESTAELVSAPSHPYPWALIHAAVENLQDSALVAANSLDGQPADPARPPAGCRFHPRCAFVADRCRTQHPELRQVGRDRWSRCLRYEELTLRTGLA